MAKKILVVEDNEDSRLIPVKYYRRLPDEIKATVANYDINRMNGFIFTAREGRMDASVSFGGVCCLQ